MANVRNANTFSIDTAGNLTIKNIRVTHILVAVNAANAVLVLSDVTTGAVKANIRIGTDETTQLFDFSDNPIVFPNGIDATTVTNCTAVLNIAESRG